MAGDIMFFRLVDGPGLELAGIIVTVHLIVISPELAQITTIFLLCEKRLEKDLPAVLARHRAARQ